MVVETIEDFAFVDEYCGDMTTPRIGAFITGTINGVSFLSSAVTGYSDGVIHTNIGWDYMLGVPDEDYAPFFSEEALESLNDS